VTLAPRDSKTYAISMWRFALSRSRHPAISLQGAEAGATESNSKSAAYENRTKSAKCGGLETNGRRERILSLDRHVAVRRSARNARGYWASIRLKSRQRMLLAQGLAEGEELGSNVLLICNPKKW
jgi:hypothetical protein